jgi:hypothetical protein
MVFEIEYPGSLSRRHLLLKVFFGWLYVGLTHGIILYLYGIAVGIVIFFAFFAILFTGKFPRGMFDFVVGYQRWVTRVTMYLSLMTDKFPPFRSSP